MTPAVVLMELYRRGIQVEVQAGRLRVRPADRMTDDLREKVSKHKAAIIGMLSGPAPEIPEEPATLRLDATDRRVIAAIRNGETIRLSSHSRTHHEVPDGWTIAGWHDRLLYLANACERNVPKRAAELRAWADRIKPTGANKEGAR